MQLPPEVPVMTLPNATLFPQTLLPLYIFEPRYRQMLLDALHTNRMFAVAMQKPLRRRETPMPVAGLGLIRVSVGHQDGTSHLILQGIARVQLAQTVRYKPYRVQRIRPLQGQPCNPVAVDAFVAKVRELLEEWVRLGLPLTFPGAPRSMAAAAEGGLDTKVVLDYLDQVTDPEQVADLVSCSVLHGPEQRQTILATADLGTRLKHLIHFLMAEIGRHGKDKAQ